MESNYHQTESPPPFFDLLPDEILLVVGFFVLLEDHVTRPVGRRYSLDDRAQLQHIHLLSISRRFCNLFSPVPAKARGVFIADESRAWRLVQSLREGRTAPKSLTAVVEDSSEAEEALVALLRVCSGTLEHLVLLPALRRGDRQDPQQPQEPRRLRGTPSPGTIELLPLPSVWSRSQPSRTLWAWLEDCVSLETFEIASALGGAPKVSAELASGMIACWPRLRELRVNDLEVTGPSNPSPRSRQPGPHALKILYCHITSPSSSTLFSSIILANPLLSDLNLKVNAQLPLAGAQILAAIRPGAAALIILRIRGIKDVSTLTPRLITLHQLQCETSAFCPSGATSPDDLFAALSSLPRLRQIILVVNSYHLDIRSRHLVKFLKSKSPPLDLLQFHVRIKAKVFRGWTTEEHAEVARAAGAVGTKFEIKLP